LYSAGLDQEIKVWDIRSSGQAPLCTYYGHVPHSGRRLRRIHHPVFYAPNGVTSQAFLLSGGETSHSLSMFQHHGGYQNTACGTRRRETLRSAVFSRGTLPDDIGGDVGAIAVQGKLVAASIDGGDILLLAPSKQ
jgi:hypothetical protein